MSARSKALFTGSVTANGLTTLYTVPAARRTILKGIALFNNAGSAQNVIVVITTGAGDVYLPRFYLAANGSAGDSDMRIVWLVLEAGEILKLWRSSGTSNVYAHFAGAELVA